MNEPDPISPTLTIDGLAVFIHETIDSTNNEAKRLLRVGKIDDFALIVANEQTAGRGTRGRSWISPKAAGLYMSIACVKGYESVTQTETLTRRVGSACCELLATKLKIAVETRGVNDLFAQGKKLGGVLTEASVAGERIDWLVVGLGINVRSQAVELDADNTNRPIALDDLLEHPLAQKSVIELRNALASALIQCIRNT